MGLDGGDALQVGPELQSAVSADGGEVLVLLGLGVSGLGDPLSVVVVDGGVALQLSLDVPQRQVLVVASGEDLAVVSRESDSLDFLLLRLDELSDALGVSHVPKSEGSVPRGAEDVDVVAGDTEIGDEVVVAGQASVRLTEGLSLDVVLVLQAQVPDDQGLVS